MTAFEDMAAKHKADSKRRMDKFNEAKINEDKQNALLRRAARDFLEETILPILHEAQKAFLDQGIGFSVIPYTAENFVDPHILVSVGTKTFDGGVTPPMGGNLRLSYFNNNLAIAEGGSLSPARFTEGQARDALTAAIDKITQAYFAAKEKAERKG